MKNLEQQVLSPDKNKLTHEYSEILTCILEIKVRSIKIHMDSSKNKTTLLILHTILRQSAKRLRKLSQQYVLTKDLQSSQQGLIYTPARSYILTVDHSQKAFFYFYFYLFIYYSFFLQSEICNRILLQQTLLLSLSYAYPLPSTTIFDTMR